MQGQFPEGDMDLIHIRRQVIEDICLPQAFILKIGKREGLTLPCKEIREPRYICGKGI